MRASSRLRGEDGAVAFMTVILSIVILGAAAIAIDISMLAMERQKLHDAIDAAAHAGAYTMPGDGATAMDAARDMALANDPDLTYDFTEQNPQIRLWCLVASTGTSTSVRTDQIPSTCNCNTVEVVAEKDVDFRFANIFGQSEGSTGSVSSAACEGSCGQEAPNPLDVVFMADRTTSMSEGDRTLMKTAILDTLKTMTPSLHYVAFGALHKSRTGTSCATDPTQYDSYGTHLASGMKGAARYLLGYAPNNLSSLPARARWRRS